MTRLAAYVLAGDPVFLAQSLRSYYGFVEKIVVSFDDSGRSWSGSPLPIDECLDIVTAVDQDGKVVLAPGSFCDPDREPLTSDTLQRQAALDEAANHGDWVLQLDADEVVTSPARLQQCLSNAVAAGFDALDYPSRWLYASLGDNKFLEASRRFWGPAMSYPGPLAVRSGSSLTHCRQVRSSIYRVDVRQHNTDPFHPADAVVHEVVPIDDAVLHYSWARPLASLQAKAVVSGHANDWDWQRAIRTWEWRTRHPFLAAVSNPLRPHGHPNWIRLTKSPGGRAV